MSHYINLHEPVYRLESRYTSWAAPFCRRNTNRYCLFTRTERHSNRLPRRCSKCVNLNWQQRRGPSEKNARHMVFTKLVLTGLEELPPLKNVDSRQLHSRSLWFYDNKFL